MTKSDKKWTYKSTNVRGKKVRPALVKLALNAMATIFPQQTESMIKQRFFRPVRRKATPEEQRWLNSAGRFHIRVHGKSIQCLQWGHGPQILAVHGWNGRGVNLHPLYTLLLQQGYSVVSFDAPAHGESEGDHTNYFELTDTVRAMIHAMGKEAVAGIIGYSMGASAVINCLSKEDLSTNTVLIAPALRLRELLFNTFINHGVPQRLYTSIIGGMETAYGYDLGKDNPFGLLEQLDARLMIAHDRDDRLIPYADTRTIADRRDNIVLHTTLGLGHKNIVRDISTGKAVLDYLSDFAGFNQSRQKTA